MKRITLMTLALLALSCAGNDEPAPAPEATTPVTAAPAVVGHFESAMTTEVSYPTHIAIAADGTIFVSDVATNKVYGTKNGKRTVELSDLEKPLGVAVHEGRLYVGSQGRGTVEVYSLADQKWVMNLAGSFAMPNAIAVADDGTIYVADSTANVVRVFTHDGTLAGTLGGLGDGPAQLRFPVAVAVDATRVVVGDQGNHRLQIWDRQGAFVRSIGDAISEKATSVSDFKGRFTRVQGVALKGDDLYVLDSYHSHVQVLSGSGESKGFLGRGGDCTTCVRLALDIAIDAQGQVVATDPESRRWVTLTVEAK